MGSLRPAPVFAPYLPARGREFQPVGTLARATDLLRFGFPYGIMIVPLTNQGMGDLVQNRIADIVV